MIHHIKIRSAEFCSAGIELAEMHQTKIYQANIHTAKIPPAEISPARIHPTSKDLHRWFARGFFPLLIAGIGLMMGTGLAGCTKQLNSQEPTTTLADANFWQQPSDLALACNYLYAYLPGLNYQSDPVWGGNISSAPGVPPMQEFLGTDAFGSSVNAVSNGTLLTPPSWDEWTKNYALVRAANNILQHSVTVTGDTGQIHKYLGEARFFRAWAYFNLVERFGDVPLLLQTVNVNDTLLYTARTNRTIVIDSVYADLDYAASKCPAAASQITAEYGRITRSAALAFKSRVALFEGTREKNFSYGSYQKDLQIAIDACNTIMTEGQHGLFTVSSATSASTAVAKDSSYYFLFQYQAEGYPVPSAVTLTAQSAASPVAAAPATLPASMYAANKEAILVKLYGANSLNGIQQHNFPVGISISTKQLYVTKHLMNQYLYADGLPAPQSQYYTPEVNTLTEFTNRDPRASMTVFNKSIPTVASGPPYGYFTPMQWYFCRKWYSAADNSANRSFLDYILIRYAEVLLNYAEATYELNGAISDADLARTINLLRARANPSGTQVSPDFLHLTNAFVSAHGLNMQTEIRREREVELALEGVHYWDLLRWKTAETEMPKDALGPKYFPAEMGTLNVKLNADSCIIYETGRTFDPSKNYLWPIPNLQIALSNNKYTQNPNW